MPEAQSPYLSLQRSEAEERRALLDVLSYDVTLDLASSEETFESTTSIRFTSHGGVTFLDLKPAALHSIELNGRALSPGELFRGRVSLDTAPGENELVVRATMPFRNDGEGLHRTIDPADGRPYVYGMSFMDAAPSVFACFDQPDLKAPYTFHITAPTDWSVEANAPGTQVEPGRWEFETSQPLSTYFVTVVAGPYHVLRTEHDGIPLSVGARASLTEALERDADEIFTITKQCFDEFHRLFGIRYPFGKYHQAFVPDFNAGAMENPGCVTFRDQNLYTSRTTRGMRVWRASTIAHEMAHQWFGNIVTPRWWDDLWLNESFAEYMGKRVTVAATDYTDAWTDDSYARRQWGLVADQSPSTHPVAGNGAVDAVAALQDFDGISYSKGSAILRQLNAALGDDVFLAGAIDHFTRHRFGNATMHDLFESWERAGGDLSGFADAWLTKAGPDAITYDRAAGVLRRTPPAASPAERSHTFRVAVAKDGAWSTETVTVSSPETPFAPDADAVVLDPYNDTWALLMADRDSVRALVGLLPGIADDGLRAGVWNNVRSAFHNARISAQDVVDLAVASYPVEDSEDSPRRTIAWLHRDVLPLAGGEAVERVHAATLDKLASVPRGSEEQLAAFRGAIRSATEPAELRGWLQATPDGIDLDDDLRWRMLTKLAQLGAITREELQAAYQDAPSAQTKVSLTGALCSLPDAEAKAYAWSVFTGEVDLTNYEIDAAGAGLWRGPDELVRPYVERYFAQVPDAVRAHAGWGLADAVEAFFPSGAVDEETIARARDVIASEGLDLTIRRVLVDQTDLLERRLAVRRAFPV